MDAFSNIQEKLLSSSDLEWFDNICELLKGTNLTVREWVQIIGQEEEAITGDIRGSKFLISIDKRFRRSFVNPDINLEKDNAKISSLGFWGADFNLDVRDIKNRFLNVLLQSNTYDGGTQLFFHPVPSEYEFSAISFNVDEEKGDIENVDALTVHSLRFHFGNELVLLKDGYTMINS